MAVAMIELIAAACRRHGVRRLELFGSAARGVDFDPASSDVGLLYEFDPTDPASVADRFRAELFAA